MTIIDQPSQSNGQYANTRWQTFVSHLKTAIFCILACTVIALVLYIRYQEGAHKGEVDLLNEQKQELQKQLEASQNFLKP